MPLTPMGCLAMVVLVVGWWIVAPRRRHLWLAVVSGVALATVDPVATAGVTLAALAVYGLARRAPDDPRWTRGLLAGTLAPLVVAKARGIVPVGMSYASFKLAHYVVELRRGRLPRHDAVDVAAYLLLLPAYTAGPIERFERFVADRGPRTDVGVGLARIAQGLVKKFVLADLILGGVLVHLTPEDVVADPASVTVGAAWAFVVRVFVYNYLDFSAYSDLAVGGCRLLGIRIVENFHWPMAAANISDFWKRWHRSLTQWCQAYVYLPTLARTRSPYAAVYATFLVMGVWHAPTGAWVCWGLWHATGVSAYLTWRRALRTRGIAPPRGMGPRGLAHAGTLAFVSAGYAFTGLQHAGSPVDSLRLLGRLVGIG